MANIKSKIDGKRLTFRIIDGSDNFWKNYHVAKHVIINSRNEQFHKIIKVTDEEIIKIKGTLKDEFNCAVEHNVLQKDSCNQCSFTDKCRSSLELFIEKYINMIRESINDDRNMPTHAHYEKLKSSYATTYFKNILFIDKYGSTIIARKQNNFYKLISCYRNTVFSNISDIELAFKKIMDDNDWIRRMNIDMWNNRLNYKKIKSVEKHLSENWV